MDDKTRKPKMAEFLARFIITKIRENLYLSDSFGDVWTVKGK